MDVVKVINSRLSEITAIKLKFDNQKSYMQSANEILISYLINVTINDRRARVLVRSMRKSEGDFEKCPLPRSGESEFPGNRYAFMFLPRNTYPKNKWWNIRRPRFRHNVTESEFPQESFGA